MIIYFNGGYRHVSGHLCTDLRVAVLYNKLSPTAQKEAITPLMERKGNCPK